MPLHQLLDAHDALEARSGLFETMLLEVQHREIVQSARQLRMLCIVRVNCLALLQSGHQVTLGLSELSEAHMFDAFSLQLVDRDSARRQRRRWRRQLVGVGRSGRNVHFKINRREAPWWALHVSYANS